MPTDIAKLWITFDFELGWGVVENQRWIPREKSGVYEHLHSQFNRLLAMLEKHEMPVCWATVGAMSESAAQHEFDYLPDGLRGKLERFCKDSKGSTRDGRKLIDSLLSTNHQRIVSHSYSHVVYTADSVTEDQVLIDLEKVSDIMHSLDGLASTMVLPENRIPDLDLLLRAGVDVIRLPPHYKPERMRLMTQKLFLHPPADVSASESITYYPGSMLFKPRGHDFLSRRTFDLQVAGLKYQLKNGTSQHIWLHPFNFGEYVFLLSAFENFVSWAAGQREIGNLDIECMGGK